MKLDQTVSTVIAKANDVIRMYYEAKDKETIQQAVQDMILFLQPLIVLRDAMEEQGMNTKEISEVIMKMDLIAIQ